jgi:hypothetical protein
LQVATYTIPNSKWSFNSISSIYYQIFGDGAKPSKSEKFIAYINPNVNYQAWTNLGLTAGYEWDADSKIGQNLFQWNNMGTYMYLGASWDAFKNFNFEPELAIRPGGAIGADSTQIQALFTYKIL